MGSGTIICQGLYIWTKNDQSGRQKVRISNYLALVIARKSHAYFIIAPPPHPPPKKEVEMSFFEACEKSPLQW